VAAGRDQLEQDRQQIAERRYWDPIIALTLESTRSGHRLPVTTRDLLLCYPADAQPGT
jgi:hypothetical protein